MSGELLKDREWEMLLLCVKGLSREEAGRRHGVGSTQAGNIVRSAIKKLGARDTAHAFAIGLVLGIYRLEELCNVEIPQQAREVAELGGFEVPSVTREALERGRRNAAEVEAWWAAERADIRRVLREQGHP